MSAKANVNVNNFDDSQKSENESENEIFCDDDDDDDGGGDDLRGDKVCSSKITIPYKKQLDGDCPLHDSFYQAQTHPYSQSTLHQLFLSHSDERKQSKRKIYTLL